MHQSCNMTPKPPSLSPFATNKQNSNDTDNETFNHSSTSSINSVKDKCIHNRHPSRYIAIVGGQQSLNIAASYPTTTTAPSLLNLNKLHRLDMKYKTSLPEYKIKKEPYLSLLLSYMVYT